MDVGRRLKERKGFPAAGASGNGIPGIQEDMLPGYLPGVSQGNAGRGKECKRKSLHAYCQTGNSKKRNEFLNDSRVCRNAPHTVFRIISGTNTEANERNCPDCGRITPAAWPFRFSRGDTGIRVDRVPEVPGKE